MNSITPFLVPIIILIVGCLFIAYFERKETRRQNNEMKIRKITREELDEFEKRIS